MTAIEEIKLFFALGAIIQVFWISVFYYLLSKRIIRVNYGNAKAIRSDFNEMVKVMNNLHNKTLEYVHKSFTEFGEKGEVQPPSTVRVDKSKKGYVYAPSKDIDVVGKGDLVDEWE